jgi:hypothetical protein
MEQNGLPCLDLLDATPDILRGLMCELSSEDAQWKPTPDRFMTEGMPELEPDDAQMYLDLYRGRDAEDKFTHFAEQRTINIEYLRGLPAGAGDRRAFHKEAGVITLAQMLHEWVLHDLGYIRQIAELVRARRYRAGAGPLGESYQLKP